MKKIVVTIIAIIIPIAAILVTVIHPELYHSVCVSLDMKPENETHSPDDGHNHGASEEDDSVLALSDQALKNIGIVDKSGFGEIKLSDYTKKFTFPAVVEEVPATTLTKIPSPVGGVIEKIYNQPGQMIVKGQPLFDIKLTREDVIATQIELLMLLQKQDIINREIERLSGLQEGLAPQAKRDTAFQKLENDTAISAKRNMLILNGLPEKDVENSLEKDRKIISRIVVYAPIIDEDCSAVESEHPCEHHHQLDAVYVKKGESVELGEPLCQISDMDKLLIRGMAYTYNESVLRQALENKAEVTAAFSEAGNEGHKIAGLQIRNISNRINADDRTLDFYVDLTNELEQHDEKNTQPNPYLSWRYKPGQRGELAVSYDTIKQCFVVPVWAVAKELNNSYIFEWIGMDSGNKVLKRRPVHVILQTKDEVVIANDGSIVPGATIALFGASQIQVALDSGSGKLQSACPCGEH